MKIKLEENVTTGVIPVLEKLGPDVQTTSEEGLTGEPDSEIGSAAQSEQRFLITQDLDFSDVRKFAPGTHQGNLLLRLHSSKQAAIISRITRLFENEDTEAWPRCFLVASEHKARVLRR